MDRTPSIEDPYAVFAQLTADPYLSQLSPVQVASQSARAPTFPAATSPPEIPPPVPEMDRTSSRPTPPQEPHNPQIPTASQPPSSPPAYSPNDNFLTTLPNILPTGHSTKRHPKFSSPSTAHTPLLSTLRRYLVAIFRSRIPLCDADICNPYLSQAFTSSLPVLVWRLVYELVDWEGAVGLGGGGTEVERVKRRLVTALVGCVVWEGLDGRGQAGKLVEELWPRVGA